MFSIINTLRSKHSSARADHLELGARGEQRALEYLKEFESYRIVAVNFTVQIGRGLRGNKVMAELDIIAYDEDVLVFVEVKTRSSGQMVAPERAVDLRKQRQIVRAARRYRQLMKVTKERYRYDVVTVVAEERGWQIELLRGYFDEKVFLRGRYFREDWF